jgi:exopolyphosphatase/guanosine-5'-triphosphate,3'-diphosphate pyrophosphatase
LRIAGGLDRSHTQQVDNVTARVRRKDDRLERVELLVHAPENPEVDLWGARRRVELFEEVFGCPLEVEWAELAETNGSLSSGQMTPQRAGD